MSPGGYAIETSFAKTSIVSSWMYGAMSATHETSARPSVMISASISAAAVAVRVAAAHEQSSPTIAPGRRARYDPSPIDGNGTSPPNRRG